MTRYPVDVIIEIVKKNINNRIKDISFSLDGHEVKINTDTLKTFARDGIQCRGCGITGDYFVVEYNGQSYNLHLYALNKLNTPVLMTKDHIKPKSKGGANNFSNYQTMCSMCNMRKGDQVYESRDTRQTVRQDCQHEYALQYN